MKIKILTSIIFAAFAATSGTANAGLLWGNSAGGSIVIEAVDQDTLAVVHQYSAGSGNGRGVVVVGDVVYWTRTSDNNIYKMNANTGAALGSISTSVASMSTIGWDGSQFWTSDYSGSNQAYRIDISGVVTKTITLASASTNMDGMEFFNGKLISNRCDACGVYDIYDLDGILLTPDFITSAGNSTGIAYDGTNFIVSNIFNNSISKFSGTTGVLLSTATIGGPAPNTGNDRLWEDLSVDYAAREDTGGGNGTVPEPATLALVGLGFVGMAAMRRRKMA